VIFGLVPEAGGQLPDDCSELLATLIDQALLVQESSDAARATADRHILALRGLCHALDARSASTEGHHALVARTAGQLARRLGAGEEVARLVVDAAMVHDVGLLAATAEAAMAAEFAHPSLGAEMAALVPGAADLAPLIRTHHEWWDGYGFPAGLTGEAIPLGGRILAAAEFYAEMLQTSHGADRAALTREIKIRRGTQLDPDCADTLEALAEEAA
jgi:HD-GYP domain-containing protein (c-di-GMP phosphodiesterase class II)